MSIGNLIDWLVRDERKDLFEVVVALVLNVLFLALIALLLWPLDRLRLALGLARGYGIFWIVVCVTTVLVKIIHNLFRVNLYDHSNAFVISNLAVSCLLQLGWAVFGALTVHSFVTGLPAWVVVILYLVGVLSCLIAFFAVSAFYQGHLYKFVSLPLALVSFVVFSLLL